MTAARILGYERGEAARFSMLTSIPTILAAGTLAALDIAKATHQPLITTVAISTARRCRSSPRSPPSPY